MPRLFVVCIALGLVTILAEAEELTVTVIAHAAVHVTDGRVAVLIDFPYDPGTEFTPWSPALVPEGPKALCLITHNHRDHFAPELAPRFCSEVVGPRDVIAGTRVASAEPRPEIQRDGLMIHAVVTPHDAVEHLSYLLEWHGVRLYFAGDAENISALLEARDLDAAFVTPGQLMALNKKGDHLYADRIISYHHRPGDPVPDFQGRLIPRPGQVLRFQPK